VIPIAGWLVTTGTGRRLLIDTGFPAGYATDERACALADRMDSFGRLVEFGLAQTVTGALALHGLVPGDIGHVILTHSHIDHVGGLPLFPHATIIMGAAERALPRPLYFGDRRPMDWPSARYRLVGPALQVCRGLRVIPTPGHTPGHLSVLVRTPGGAVVLAADAINRCSEPGEGYPDAMDPVTAARSGDRLMRLAQRTGAVLVPGHEPLAAKG
jgi:N-acyl homoserine lactone hydrolase